MCASNQRVLPKIQSGFYLVQVTPSTFRFFLPPQVESIIVCSDTVRMLRDLCPHKNIGSVTAAAEDYCNPPPRPWIIDKRTKKKRGEKRREDKWEGKKTKKTDPSFQTSSHYNLGGLFTRPQIQFMEVALSFIARWYCRAVRPRMK